MYGFIQNGTLCLIDIVYTCIFVFQILVRLVIIIDILYICFSSAGIAFPTCVSVNNCICHFSPLKSDPDVTIKNGDVVKM